MIPINNLSKLILRSRPNLLQTTKTIVTSAMQQKQGHSDGGSKQQQQCSDASGSSHTGKTVTPKIILHSPEHDQIQKHKQGEGSSCRQKHSKNDNRKENYENVCKTSAENRDGCMKLPKVDGQGKLESTECSCPPYDTTKCVEEEDIQPRTLECHEKYVSSGLRQDDISNTRCSLDSPESLKSQSEESPCGIRKPKGSSRPEECRQKNIAQSENDRCKENDNAKKRDQHCGPILPPKIKCSAETKSDECGKQQKNKYSSSCGAQEKSNSKTKDSRRTQKCIQENIGQSENDRCATNENSKKWGQYCGPIISSKDKCGGEAKEDECGKHRVNKSYDGCGAQENRNCMTANADLDIDNCQSKTACDEIQKNECNPCASSRDNCPENRNKYDEKIDPCGPDNSPKSKCSGKNHEINDIRCPDTREEPCFDDQTECKTPDVPELPPCCRVDSARECIRELKELQRQWEEIVAAHERLKDDCGEDQELKTAGCSEQTRERHRNSNMMHAVLCAILGGVAYYAINGDFEPEHLFLEEEVREDIKNDEDEN